MSRLSAAGLYFCRERGEREKKEGEKDNVCDIFCLHNGRELLNSSDKGVTFSLSQQEKKKSNGNRTASLPESCTVNVETGSDCRHRSAALTDLCQTLQPLEGKSR